MLYPIKVVDIELSQPVPTFDGLEKYMGLQGLVRLHGVPLGYVKAPVSLGRCTAATLSKLILEQHSWAIISQLLKNGLASPQRSGDLKLEDLINLPPVEYVGEWPLVTVAVCTRDRPDDMRLCLEAISKLDYPHLDILVVDNAPTSDSTEKVVQHYTNARYVCEPRPGLDWARNRAILEARGEVIAYTDDDVIVDSGWVKALARVFAQNPDVMAVTGLVVPYELEMEPQVLFEMYGGFGRGFQRKWRRVDKGSKMPWGLLGTGQFGAGANMAYRRCVFDDIGYFDPAMDVGTVTNGGGDLEMYFRVLKEGHTLVYEPNAIVRHRHRQDYAKLRTQIANNGIGLYSYFTCGIHRYPDEQFNFLFLSVYWLAWWHIRRLLISFVHPLRFPRDLILAELRGFFQNFGRYRTARRRAKEIEASFSASPQPSTLREIQNWQVNVPPRQPRVAVLTVELSQPLPDMTDAACYSEVRLFATWHQSPMGSVHIHNTYQPISQDRLIEAIANSLGLEILQARFNLSKDLCWTLISNLLAQKLSGEPRQSLPEQLPTEVSISIVISTCDRPQSLHRCLTHLVAQTAHRSPQILVVDNNPKSGLTAPIVKQFPNVFLLHEPRRGISYARNRGILASTGEIIITLDDDITVSETWLENLLAPFARHEVMAVTGNILPLELETPAQRWFELYGTLGRGFERFEANGDRFEACLYRSVPTWDFGSCTNAAFRTLLFNQPQIGLMEEHLGRGTPAGSGDDLYLFYKILKAGYTIVYQPTACVWHQHSRDMSTLRRQIFNDGKGHVAYQLSTLIQDGDLRVLARLLVGLPLQHFYRIYFHLRGWKYHPLWMTLLEIAGNLVGSLYFSYSHCRVLLIGRSKSLVLPSQDILSTTPVLSEEAVNQNAKIQVSR
ncbi:glycosyltransferase [Altericista sp. CCNU0014]|uniref:glycosyltransferase n=1 Tax=Altericista sp. CCNU0014 TaxID=3082949 RepID=UPI00384B1BC2